MISNKRYMPRIGDGVIGIIADKTGDYYTVNIFSGHPCLMSRLAFDGATKRNKPELNRGDLVYAHITTTKYDSDTEITCHALWGPKKDWSTGEAIYGELPMGLLVKTSPQNACRMLQPENSLLTALSRYFCFEVTIGLNGAVWLRSFDNSAVDMIVIRNAILCADGLDEAQIIAMVDELVHLSKKVGRSIST